MKCQEQTYHLAEATQPTLTMVSSSMMVQAQHALLEESKIQHIKHLPWAKKER